MEDIQRDLERELEKSASMRAQLKRKLNWDLLFVADTGEVIEVRKFKKVLTTIAVVFGVSIVIALVLSLVYWNILNSNRELQAEVDNAKQEIRVKRENLDMLMARLVLAESELERIKSGEVRQEVVPEEFRKPQYGPKKDVKKSSNIKIELKRFKVTKDENTDTLRVRFSIKNTSRGLKSISGRIFIILKPEEGGQYNWLAAPSVELISGKPGNYKRGQFFSISRFKTVKFKLKDRNPANHYSECVIYIFTNEGDLVVEKTFPVRAKVVGSAIKKPEKKIAPASQNSTSEVVTSAQENSQKKPEADQQVVKPPVQSVQEAEPAVKIIKEGSGAESQKPAEENLSGVSG